MNEYWGLLSQAGLWGWIISVLVCIHKTFPTENSFVSGAAVKWGGVAFCFFVCWISGMLLA